MLGRPDREQSSVTYTHSPGRGCTAGRATWAVLGNGMNTGGCAVTGGWGSLLSKGQDDLVYIILENGSELKTVLRGEQALLLVPEQGGLSGPLLGSGCCNKMS